MNADTEFPYEAPLRDGIARIVEQALAWNDPAAAIGALVDRVIEMVEILQDRLVRDQPPPRPLACQRGCDHCCHTAEVNVTPLEAIRIADHIAESFNDEARLAVHDRIRATAVDKLRHAPGGRNPNIPCPLLVNGACSVYSVRPLLCRGFNSYDVANCIDWIRDGDADNPQSSAIEGYVHSQRVMVSASRGFRHGLASRGLSPDMHELVAALKIAVDEPDAARRWLADEPLFRPARSRLAGHRGEWVDSAEYGADGHDADPPLT
jgi:Fe-S-cluster containining protein